MFTRDIWDSILLIMILLVALLLIASLVYWIIGENLSLLLPM